MVRPYAIGAAILLCGTIATNADARPHPYNSYSVVAAHHVSCAKTAPKQVCRYAKDVRVYRATPIEFWPSRQTTQRNTIERLVYGHVGSDAEIRSWAQRPDGESFIARGTIAGAPRDRWTLLAEGYGSTILLHVRGTYVRWTPTKRTARP